jgi:hypothetical protein
MSISILVMIIFMACKPAIQTDGISSINEEETSSKTERIASAEDSATFKNNSETAPISNENLEKSLPNDSVLPKNTKKDKAEKVGEIIAIPDVNKMDSITDEPDLSKIIDSLELETEIESEPTEKPAPNGTHDIWNSLLVKYVNERGDVDYKGMLSSSAKLDAYLQDLTATKISELSNAELMAFWINAYNAFTIRMILDHFPVNSIMDIGNGKIWDRNWISIDGKTYSLNDIEKNELLKKFHDPRIHFAVNCAAASCPPLANKAWTGDNLNSMLDNRTKQFLADPTYNILNKESVRVSKIFNWYAGDFGNLIEFLNKYSSMNINSNAKIEFFEYDWKLNKQ